MAVVIDTFLIDTFLFHTNEVPL